MSQYPQTLTSDRSPFGFRSISPGAVPMKGLHPLGGCARGLVKPQEHLAYPLGGHAGVGSFTKHFQALVLSDSAILP